MRAREPPLPESLEGAWLVVLVVKNPSASAGNVRDASSILGSRRFHGGGHGNPLQYYCLWILWTEDPGGLPSIGLQRVGQDWIDLTCKFLPTVQFQTSDLQSYERINFHCFKLYILWYWYNNTKNLIQFFFLGTKVTKTILNSHFNALTLVIIIIGFHVA